MGRLTSTRTRRRLLRVIAASVLVIGALAMWALAAGPGVEAIALSGGKVYAGGTFQDAGGHADADFLAAWDGSWKPFCNDPKPRVRDRCQRDEPADHRPHAFTSAARSRTARTSPPPTTCSPATSSPARPPTPSPTPRTRSRAPSTP